MIKLNNMRLSQKFNLLLLLVFLVAVLLSGFAFSAVLKQNTEQVVTDKAQVLLKTMLAVRQYTSDQVNPLLTPQLEQSAEFLPETVPGYSAREVFENLRKNSEYGDFFYKEATLNPTNLRDKADPFETEIVKQFQSNQAVKELTGYRETPAGDLFYIARPIVVSAQSCLRCHSVPDAAPKSQLVTYGRSNGFGWKLNEIVGAQVMSVPASDLVRQSRQAFFLFMGIVALAFALVLLVINLLLKKAVIQPIDRMAKVADEVSMGNMDVEFRQKSNDEVGKLAAAFNRMKTSLVMAMNMLGRGE